MRKLLILAVITGLLGGTLGCRFLDCMRRGPAYQTVPAATISSPTLCPPITPPVNACDPGAITTTVPSTAPTAVPPGPETYAPQPTR